VQWVPGLSLG